MTSDHRKNHLAYRYVHRIITDLYLSTLYSEILPDTRRVSQEASTSNGYAIWVCKKLHC